MIVAEMLSDDPPRENKPAEDPPRRTPRKSNDK
jgi:hypothetical protein